MVLVTVVVDGDPAAVVVTVDGDCAPDTNFVVVNVSVEVTVAVPADTVVVTVFVTVLVTVGTENVVGEGLVRTASTAPRSSRNFILLLPAGEMGFLSRVAVLLFLTFTRCRGGGNVRS